MEFKKGFELLMFGIMHDSILVIIIFQGRNNGPCRVPSSREFFLQIFECVNLYF